MGFKVEFKEDIDVGDLKFITSNLTILLRTFIDYCQKKNLPCMITSLRSDRKNIKSVSNTHETGRAFDASVKGWDTDEIDACVHDFNRNYRNIGAISISDGVPRACIYHDSGYGSHLHFQVVKDGT